MAKLKVLTVDANGVELTDEEKTRQGLIATLQSIGMIQKDIDEFMAYFPKDSKGRYYEPVLFPGDKVKETDIVRRVLISTKLDGHRFEFIFGVMLSRQFKPMPNPKMEARFENLKEFSKRTGIILDGEVYSHGLTFQEIGHFLRTQDTKTEEIPESLCFYCFDIYDPKRPHMTAQERYEVIKAIAPELGAYFVAVEQTIASTPLEITQAFELALDLGYEGLIAKDPNSFYKFGRLTWKSRDGCKFKPYETFDAEIIGIEQSTQIKDGVARTIDAFGRSETSGKKDDRELINKACAFITKYENHTLKVSLRMPDAQKIWIWKNQEKVIGKKFEYTGMLVGSKDVPRHPYSYRMRPDKDGIPEYDDLPKIEGFKW